MNQLAVNGDNRMRAALYGMCHAREREHPEYHDATRLVFAPLSAASRLTSSLHRIPRLDSRFLRE
jgi:hypothetical protein